VGIAGPLSALVSADRTYTETDLLSGLYGFGELSAAHASAVAGRHSVRFHWNGRTRNTLARIRPHSGKVGIFAAHGHVHRVRVGPLGLLGNVLLAFGKGAKNDQKSLQETIIAKSLISSMSKQ